MDLGLQWDEIGLLAKIWWWIKLIFFLLLAVPVCILEAIFLPAKRRMWRKTWGRVWFMWQVIFWPPIRTSAQAQLQGLRQITFPAPELPVLNLNWEFNNLLRNSLVVVCIVLILYTGLTLWVVVPKGEPIASSGGIPTIEPTAIVTLNDLALFEKEHAFQSNPLGSTNIALIKDRGQEVYSPYTFEFRATEPWVKVNRLLFVTALSVSEGKVELADERGFRHQFNTLQPFVFYQQQKYAYLIDEEGQIWQAEIAKLNPIRINQQ